MAQGVPVPASKVNEHGEERELSPASCTLVSTHSLQRVHPLIQN